jgi:membrane-bound lytic murein transglycosylase F
MNYDPAQLNDPETAIAAGVEYLYKMLLNFDPALPLEERLHFALASYNAGYGHIIDARRLARDVPKDRNIWIDHVDHAIVLLEQPKYAEAARHGYCRGSEPHTYVRNIASFYEAYVDVVPAEAGGD